MSEPGAPYVVALGAAISANKGAASMLYALVDSIDQVLPGAGVVSLSTYPDADRRENQSPNLEIIDYRPLSMAAVHFPLALLAAAVRLLGGSGELFIRTRALRTLRDSAVVADLAGISFSDGRGVPTLIYNALMTSVPLLLGVPVVKCSQAVGPFAEAMTRWTANLILPRVASVVARGSRTYDHLRGLGLANVVEGADLAFLMAVDERHEKEARALVSVLSGRPFFVVSASSVVEELCAEHGLDYVDLMAGLVDRLVAETGSAAVLVAHSARPGQGPGRMNDLPVVRGIANRLAGRSGVHLIDESLDPRVLRALIGDSRFLLASRFHAMISGLATQTPTVVIGWSHKYREVMAEFGLERYVVQFSDFNSDALLALSLELSANRDEIAEQIGLAIPAVQASSNVSILELEQNARV